MNKEHSCEVKTKKRCFIRNTWIFLSTKYAGTSIVSNSKKSGLFRAGYSCTGGYSGNTDDGSKFLGEIVHQIQFGMDKKAVRDILGPPNRTGGGFQAVWGAVPLWDKFYFDSYSLHIQYSKRGKSIDLITIGSLTIEPDLNSPVH